MTAGLALPPALNPQPPTSNQHPTFEVASIKPNKSDTNRVNLNLEPGGRFTAVNVSLQALIGVAYGDPMPLPPNRMVLNQKWIGGVARGGYATADRFDIEAKAGRNLTQQELAAALRGLLEDRFKLAVHHEIRKLPIYALVMDRADRRPGPRLKRSAVDCADPREYTAKNSDGTAKCGFRSRPGSASGRHTIRVLTGFFTNAVVDHRPVEDRTGLDGTYEFQIEWSPEVPVPADAPPGPPVDPNGPSIFTAAREQLGLKLEPATTDIAVLVVDRAEHPAEN
jgi:uncharacterized protein (TIGR03435 family)